MNTNASSRMCSMFARDPVSRLSTQITRCPSASRCSHRCDPRKPAPPVTTEVGIESILGRPGADEPRTHTTFTQRRCFFFTAPTQFDRASARIDRVPAIEAQTSCDSCRYGGRRRTTTEREEEHPMENVTLMELVGEVRDLPLTVSAVRGQVISECDNADASVSSLARIMAGDQALAAMVLKLANSAYYGYARKIESLPDAVVLLGFASVKNLAITASITRLLASDRDDLFEVRQCIFEHSLATAVS